MPKTCLAAGKAAKAQLNESIHDEPGLIAALVGTPFNGYSLVPFALVTES
ncbi:MAG TPA: hypothetical protein VJL34_12180 [Anaerolineales bacterium]|nr:hypothetical protein [Anaerolineales bacterium]